MVRKTRRVQKTVKTHASASKNKIPTKKDISRRNRFGETLLHQAVLKADIQLLKEILKLGINVNRGDNTGRTALHEAAVRDQYEACCCLINAGALVNIETRNKITPLHEAITFGNKRIVELFQKHGEQQQLKAEEEQATFGITEGHSFQVQGEHVQNENVHSLSASLLLSTEDVTGLSWDFLAEDMDSDQTVDYMLTESSQSEDWPIYATQDFCFS